MRDKIETCAWISVARGCGFAGLAILCAMTGMSFDPPAALKFGGFSTLLVCAVLILKALRAAHVRYKDTETWLLLDDSDRPPAAIAQGLVMRARRQMLLSFARVNAMFATGCFSGSFLTRAWLGA